MTVRRAIPPTGFRPSASAPSRAAQIDSRGRKDRDRRRKRAGRCEIGLRFGPCQPTGLRSARCHGDRMLPRTPPATAREESVRVKPPERNTKGWEFPASKKERLLCGG